MRVSIIRADNIVSVDGVAFGVGCANLPPHVHAIQWFGMAGEIEYAEMRNDAGAVWKLPNQAFHDFTPYQGYVDAWTAQKAIAEAEAKRLAAEAAKQAATAPADGA